MSDEGCRIKSNETPEEIRIRGRQFVGLSNRSNDREMAAAYMGWAHTLFRLADMIERGGSEQETRH